MILNASLCRTPEDDIANYTGCPSRVAVGMCWEASIFNVTRFNVCPVNEYQVSRTCTVDGWKPSVRALFFECLDAAERAQLVVNSINFSGYPITILMCGFALTFIALSDKLRKRFHNIIHLNLYISLMMYALISLARPLVMAYVASVPRPACVILRLLTVNWSASRFTWLCAEGIYMYYSLANPFSKTKRVKHAVWIVGWGLPAAIAVVFVIVVQVTLSLNDLHSMKCQLPHNSYLTYIVEVPIAVVMIINFSLAGYVLKVTWNKLKEFQSVPGVSCNTTRIETESIIALPEAVSRYSQNPGRIFRKQRQDCIRWLRMSKSSIIVGVMMGLHFIPAILPYELLDMKSPARYRFRLINAVLHAYSGFFISAVSFLLKPEVRRKFSLCILSVKRKHQQGRNQEKPPVMYRSKDSTITKSFSVNTHRRDQ